jgi:hypothetical protein
VLTVVCWKWREPGYRHVYEAAHVNVLRSMLARHCSLPHRLVCVTDDPADIHCETFPLWDDCAKLKNATAAFLPSCYRRLKLFDPATQAAMGVEPGQRIVSIDLDVVILGSVDHLFSTQAPFAAWRVIGSYHSTVMNGSLWMVEAGKLAWMWSEFDPDISPAKARAAGYKGSDQAWMSYRLDGDFHGWGAADGVRSYPMDLARRRTKPRGVSVAVFHGLIKPWTRSAYPRCPWIAEHWR